MDWMYNKSRVDPEEYLLGKPIDKSHFKEPSPTNFMRSIKDEPQSALSQIELSRRQKEDPLTVIKVKEFEKKKLLLQKSQVKNVDGQTVPIVSVLGFENNRSKSIHQLVIENLRQLPFNIDVEQLYNRLKERKKEKKRKKREENSSSDEDRFVTKNNQNYRSGDHSIRRRSRSSHFQDIDEKFQRRNEQNRKRQYEPGNVCRTRQNEDFRRNRSPNRRTETESRNNYENRGRRQSRKRVVDKDLITESQDRSKRNSRSTSIDNSRAARILSLKQFRRSESTSKTRNNVKKDGDRRGKRSESRNSDQNQYTIMLSKKTRKCSPPSIKNHEHYRRRSPENNDKKRSEKIKRYRSSSSTSEHSDRKYSRSRRLSKTRHHNEESSSESNNKRASKINEEKVSPRRIKRSRSMSRSKNDIRKYKNSKDCNNDDERKKEKRR